MGLLAVLSNLRKKRSDSRRTLYTQIMKQQKMAIENQTLARGQKTVIRHFTREDVDKWLAWPHHTDPLYSSSYPRAMSRLERDSWFSERSHRADYMMFAADDFQGNLVGLLTLRNIERSRSHAVLGITMRPEVLGGGLGTDSLWAFLSYYFNILHFDAMILDVAAYNRRAQRVYEKCGFIYTGDHWGHYDDYSVFYNEHYRNIREYFRQHGAWVETLYFDMILRRYDYEERVKQGFSPVKKG
jgi:RimJ/RimL family protein N-acetyltransferase